MSSLEARGPEDQVMTGKERVSSQVRLAAAAKVGRAMELPSPVASLIPSLVLKAVVTFGSW